MKKNKPQLYIGTSGFSYSSWKNLFYPPDIPSARWFEYYCTRFNTVELNNTFYRFPRVKTLEKFYERAPAQFVFSVKAHKIITHTMRLKNAREKVNEFISIVEDALKDKTGPILFQLPPSFKCSEENMETVLANIPGSPHCVVEFRHESWWNTTAINLLRAHGLTFCNVSYPGLPETIYPTGETFYLRMHGVPDLFQSSYSLPSLKKIIKKIPIGVKEKFIYFNNTTFRAGYTNAITMRKILLSE